MMILSRRNTLIGAVSLLAGSARTAVSQTSANLPDLVLGKPDAPVTIEEYASLTCPACARLHTDVLPEVRRAYIDSGKAKLIYRDYPLNELAVGAAMLCRLAGERREALLGVLYKTQDTWLSSRKLPLDELFKIGRQFGMTQTEMEKCLSDTALTNAVIADGSRFKNARSITGTPTVFVNDRRLASEDRSLAGLSKAIDAAMKKS